MRVIAIPVKSLSRTKSRLSALMSPLERGALTLAMLEDELDTTLTLTGWDTWVISPDEAVLEITVRRGARAVEEVKPPLSQALRQVERDALERDADALAVLLGDCPLVTPDALHAAFRTLGPVVAVPSDRGGGTNLLLRRPPRSMPARFGRDSMRKHRETAAERGVPMSTVKRPELGFDLDTPEDVATLMASASAQQTRTHACCVQMDLGARLPDLLRRA
jgi:2-phospho-L-lactate guanylyltransferase